MFNIIYLKNKKLISDYLKPVGVIDKINKIDL